MSPTVEPASRPRLLLIDDDPISREVISMLLEMHGYPITCAESGADALTLLVTGQPSVILMDTQMPGLSGGALIEALRARTSAQIVAISGSEVGETIRQAADGFLLKPVQPEALDSFLAASPTAPAPLQTETVGSQPESEAAIEAVIDPQVLSKLCTIMPAAAVREIYEAVAADLKIRLARLAEAMQAGDEAEVRRIAHTIKGGSSMVGVTIVIQAASRLEFSNRNGTWFAEFQRLQSGLASLERILGGEFLT